MDCTQTHKTHWLTIASALVLLLSFSSLHAQSGKSFAKDPEGFQKQVEDLFGSGDKKKAKEFLELRFIPFWTSPTMTDDRRRDVYGMGDALMKKSFRAFPHYEAFFNTLIVLEEKKDAESYEAYKRSILDLAKGSKSKFADYIEQMGLLFMENVLYTKSTLTWKADSDDFQLTFDKVPAVRFDNTRIVCYAKRDSAFILDTKGVLLPLKNEWVGQGGRVTWERAGLPASETYAEVFDYDIALKSSNFEVDSALFYNDFFPEPLLGLVTDKVLAGKSAESTSYPLFESYEQRFLIKEVGPDMDYDGGFTMKGQRLIGSGTSEQPARLIIYRDDKPFIISRSQVYTIRPDRIASENARITVYLSDDSITHPDVQLKYIKDKKQLTLVRTDEGLSKSPFFNSFHKLDMYFEALYWNIEDPVIEMGNLFGSTNTRAAFESDEYYKERRYHALQGNDPVNPLIRVRDLVKQVGNEFNVAQYANAIRMPEASAKQQLIVLANQGFLEYFQEQEYVVVRDKLESYVMDRAGKRDYDILLFNSSIDDDRNASLNLVNYDLLLRGVSKIQLSDSQRVTIYPDGQELTVKQDRDFLFDGAVMAGNLEFYGKESRFDYDEFRIDMARIDSIRLQVDEFEPKGERARRVRVKNVIEDAEGVLYIDEPKNKSGLKSEDYPQYPTFDCVKESFVYYDNNRIQDGAYDREDFFFRVNPFKLDSLDNFIANNIALEGTFTSGGIFPDIVQPLKVQDDYSLGFQRATSASGLAAYKGKSNFTDMITLNYNGLQGDGTIEYLSATAIGEQFVFLPDSTIGRTSSFINTESITGTKVPEVSAGAVDISFIPGQDLLVARTAEDPISCFNGQSAMDGEFDLRPSGMEGRGVMDLQGAELESKLFTYTDHDIFADTADFRLASQVETGFAFKTEDINAHVDFDERRGDFKANGEASFVEFPANQYVCYMDKFVWFMDQNDLALEYDGQVSEDFVIDTDLDLTKSNFWSVNKSQDSLNFMAPQAIYDLDNSVIQCNQIDFIKVADARISPDSGSVVIRRKAKMDPLIDAVITANFVTSYHTIRNAALEISSANEYEGSGDYTYVDVNNNEQQIGFSEIYVDSILQTTARGILTESDDFSLSPAFQYSGNVAMYANSKNLRFDGQTRIFHDCDLDKNWMNFSAEVDPLEVFIPVDTTLTDDIGLPVGVGLYMNNEELDLYGTFLSSIQGDRDIELMSSSGVLTFDKGAQEYLVGSPDKLRERALPGNIIAMNVNSCRLRGDGRYSFGADLGQVDADPIGTFENNTTDGSYSFKAILPVDFHFNGDATKKMVEDISTFPDIKPLSLQTSMFEKGLKEMVGLKASDKLISELTLSGTIKKLPSELEKMFVFTDIQFKWDTESASYLSEGPLGLISIGKQEIFANIAGKIRIKKKRSGDEITIYLKLDEDNWYWFNYARTVMTAYSSNPDFNDIIIDSKDDERKSKGQKGEEDYTYMLGSKSKVNRFLDDIE